MSASMEPPGTGLGAAYEYDEESSEAARDLLKLMARAKRFMTDPSAEQLSGSDRFRVKEHIRSQLSESILDDCQLFDERALAALCGFVSAWRRAAYGYQSDVLAADEVLERAYQRAAETLALYSDSPRQEMPTAS